MTDAPRHCACQEDIEPSEEVLRDFSQLRDDCPALRLVFIPDTRWGAFQRWAAEPPDRAFHRSILLLAFERRCLSKFTAPIHRFLLDGGKLRADVEASYRGALQEHWLTGINELARHQRSRGYMGKLLELRYALLLEESGWHIDGMEATGGEHDVEATSEAGISCAFEIKYIGQEDADFEAIVEAREAVDAGQPPPVQVLSPYVGSNYVVYKAYEAAFQLQDTRLRRVAVVLISRMTWHHALPYAPTLARR